MVMNLKNVVFFCFIALFFAKCSPSGEEEILSTYPNGAPLRVGYFRWKGNEKEYLKIVYFHSNGKKERIEEMKNGKKNGTCVYFRENEKKWLEENYLGGVKNGETIGWYQSGEKEFQGFYKNGLPDGKWKFWDENDNLIRTIFYENGKEVKREP